MSTRNRRRGFPLLLGVLMLMLVAAQPGDSRPPTDSVRFRVNMREAMDQLWYQMPQFSMSPNVNLSGNTQPDCADEALQRARVALTQAGVSDAFIQAVSITIEITADVAEHLLGIGWAGHLGDIANLYLESNSLPELADNLGELAAEKAGEAVTRRAGGAAGAPTGYPEEKLGGTLAKMLWEGLPKGDGDLYERTMEDLLCGPVRVTFYMSQAPNGIRRAHFRVEGNCQCRWPINRPAPMKLGRFAVVGNGELIPEDPVVRGDTVTINYHLGSMTYDVLAECGCPQEDEGSSADPGAGATYVDPRPVYQRICDQRCGSLFESWQLLEAEARLLAQQADAIQQQLGEKRSALTQREQDLQAARERLGRMEAPGRRAAGQSRSVDNQKQQIHKIEYDVQEMRAEIEAMEAQARQVGQRAAQRAAEAAAARDAYYRCVLSCYEQAMQAGELQQLPSDVEDWKRRQPPPPPPEPAASSNSMLIGVVIGNDTRTGEKTTARVVSDPKTYRGIPGVRVVEMTTNVALGKGGKPLLEHLQARIGAGPAQSCEKPVTGTVPKGAKTMRVSVGQPGTAPVTQDIPVSAGETRTAPASVRPQDFHTPAVYTAGSVQVIHGPFDGSSFGTSVQVAGRPAEIVAETAGALFFRVPEGVAPGQTAVVCEEQGTRMRFKVATVGLSMSADRLSLMKGESTSFRATVTGAEKLPPSAWQSASAQEIQDVMDMGEVRRLAPKFQAPGSGAPGMILLLLQNTTPGIVSMSGGNVVQLELNQQSFAGGPYTYTGSVHSKERGSFGINGMVVPFLAPVAGEAVP